ncbi:MAG TPA: conjugal transfer protein [Flavobacteriaceae bacterium]
MKITMKQIMLSILLVLILNARSKGQGMPVYDNTNFITLGKSLIEGAKQTAELLKTVQFLKEAKEKIEQVNNAVQQYKAVREITQNNQRLFDMVRNDLREILNSPYIHPDEIDKISDSFNLIIENSLDNLDFMGQVLSSNFLNMTDAERLAILEEQREESKKMLADINLKNKRYKTVIAYREMQDIINNRQTSY